MCTLNVYGHLQIFTICLYFVKILCSSCFPFLALLQRRYWHFVHISSSSPSISYRYSFTFYRNYKTIFCVHFIDIFCTSFGRNFMKISLTFYITYFTDLFSLNISQGLCSHFKRFFRILFKISVNFEWIL